MTRRMRPYLAVFASVLRLRQRASYPQRRRNIGRWRIRCWASVGCARAPGPCYAPTRDLSLFRAYMPNFYVRRCHSLRTCTLAGVYGQRENLARMVVGTADNQIMKYAVWVVYDKVVSGSVCLESFTRHLSYDLLLRIWRTLGPSHERC